jgi:hypothetical protein
MMKRIAVGCKLCSVLVIDDMNEWEALSYIGHFVFLA